MVEGCYYGEERIIYSKKDAENTKKFYTFIVVKPKKRKPLSVEWQSPVIDRRLRENS